jgi:AbrB family looped-hinge helix DNA binding protein
MSAARFSTKGQVVIPKNIRDDAGVRPGAEYEVTTDGQVITLVPKKPMRAHFPRLSVDEFMARRIRYDGPKITTEMIRDAAAEGAFERFERSRKAQDT